MLKQPSDRRGARTLNPRYEAIRPQLEEWEKFCAELGEEPAGRRARVAARASRA